MDDETCRVRCLKKLTGDTAESCRLVVNSQAPVPVQGSNRGLAAAVVAKPWNRRLHGDGK